MELCLMASLGYPPSGLVFPPSENGRLLKEYQIGLDQDPSRLCSFNPRPDHQAKESLKSLIGRLELDENKFLRSHLELRRPGGHVELQEFAPYPIRFGSGIAEQCTKHDRTSRFIFPGSTTEKENQGIRTLFELLKLVGPHIRTMQSWAPYCEECLHGTDPPQSFLLTPNSELCSTESSLFVGDLNHASYHTHLPDGQLSFVDYEMDVKDVLLSISEEFSPNKSINMTTRAVLVPYFDRRIRKGVKANYGESSSKVEPAKSEKAKNGTSSSSRKKTNTKAIKEKTQSYKNNNLHACESLLSLMFEKSRHDNKTALLSLKRSGPEITNLLSQFSASIAGTGLAVILSVACKVACGRLPFCTSKFLSTGLGFGLVWLSWAVNQLRDTVTTINKTSPSKFGIAGQEEVMMLSVDQRVRDIYFRVATLLAVVLLRFA